MSKKQELAPECSKILYKTQTKLSTNHEGHLSDDGLLCETACLGIVQHHNALLKGGHTPSTGVDTLLLRTLAACPQSNS